MTPERHGCVRSPIWETSRSQRPLRAPRGHEVLRRRGVPARSLRDRTDRGTGDECLSTVGNGRTEATEQWAAGRYGSSIRIPGVGRRSSSTGDGLCPEMRIIFSMRPKADNDVRAKNREKTKNRSDDMTNTAASGSRLRSDRPSLLQGCLRVSERGRRRAPGEYRNV
jgi:hypothetical protein